jgi:[protein-PII] uridylyltransferase
VAKAGQETAVATRLEREKGMTHLTLYAPDHPRLLSIIAGACAASQANIIGAQVYTTNDGMALDTITLNRRFKEDEDETRSVTHIGTLITKALKGEIVLSEALAALDEKTASRMERTAFTLVPEVSLNNGWSHRHTMIEFSGLDRPGLLHSLTSTLSALNLNITSAHIVTFGEKAVDVFYVSDLMGGKIEREDRQKLIQKKLLAVF